MILSHSGRWRAGAAIMALALGLGACSSGGVRSAGTAGSASGAEKADRIEHTREAIALLNAGEVAKGRAELMRALKAQPGDMIARSLLEQVDTDPRQLLGEEHYNYTVREGETFSILAQKYLGDPLLSYALARYNGLVPAAQLRPGQTILMPGKRKLPVPPARKPAPEAVHKPPAAAVPAPAKPTQPAANPAQAARLRGQGLAALNAGAINKAVALLRQALALDPASPLIRNDLARALRIQRTLGGGH
jgi:hypothetical protein